MTSNDHGAESANEAQQRGVGYCEAESHDGLVCRLRPGHDGKHGSLDDGEIIWWVE